MILINLLPHREERRRRRKQAFFAGLAVSAVVGAAIAGAWWFGLDQLTKAQQDRNQFLRAKIGELDAQIKDIATLKAEIEALKARQKAVEDLQTDRNVPVHLLNELVKHTPEGVYLSEIRQSGDVVSVKGVAQTNERVSELLRNTAYNATWIERPELVEITAATVQNRKLFNFALRVSLKRPKPEAAQVPGKAAPGAAAAAKKS